jgi:hypothetical protein
MTMKYVIERDGKYLRFTRDFEIEWVDEVKRAWHYSVEQVARDIANHDFPGATVVGVVQEAGMWHEIPPIENPISPTDALNMIS